MSVALYISLSKKRNRKQGLATPIDDGQAVQRRTRQHKRRKLQVSPNIRYNHFKPMLTKQHLIREGIVIDGAPDEQRETLSERHLFHFINKDESVKRVFNRRIPKYTSVFKVKCSNNAHVYVHPLDADWKVIYAERSDESKRYDILPDETPYWTDIYVCKWNNKHNDGQQ